MKSSASSKRGGENESAETTASTATIVAVATAQGTGSIGVIRLSGAAALSAARRLAPQVPAQAVPRHAYFADFKDADDADLDQGLFLYFQAPHSFTGEDVVELQTHGSPRLLTLLVSKLLQDERVRLARPGEFSRRAFLNGRLDLTRAEAVADLVSAQSESAVRAAAAQLHGALAQRLKEIRTPLLELRADVEAALGFPDEAPGDPNPQPLREALSRARALLAEFDRGQHLRRGARIVLFGPVNAGKSTLFNALLGEPRALVDEEPGTTRDLLEARLELDGLGVTLVDTAGLRDDPGRLEAKGIALTKDALRGADLALLVAPATVADDELQRWQTEAGDVTVIRVVSKADAPPAARSVRTPHERPAGAPALNESAHRLRVSAQTGNGLTELRAAVLRYFAHTGAASAVALTSERHAAALKQAVEAMERAELAVTASTLEVVSGEMGLALEALGEMTGENASAQLIDEIFRRFCIGK